MRSGAAQETPGRRARPGRAVRACRREDLDAVASLYEAVMRSGARVPAPGLAAYFARTLFDCPWADAEIPSLVYEDAGGRILGFLGSHVRRLRVDGRSVRVAWSGQLVADPAAAGRAVGAVLMRAFMAGAQAATLTDGANEASLRMWDACGGETAHLRSFAWTRVLRPARFAAEALARRTRRRALARRLAPILAPLDAAALRLGGRLLRPKGRATSAEALDARGVMDHLPLVTELLRAWPEYDEAYLEWLFREMGAVKSRGALVRALVRDDRGQALGWYAYFREGALARVCQVAARRGAAGEVLDALFHRALAEGAAAVQGRAEPQLAAALAARRCLFAWSGGTLVHSRDAALLSVLLSGRCWLGLMDGESWMGHHREMP